MFQKGTIPHTHAANRVIGRILDDGVELLDPTVHAQGRAPNPLGRAEWRIGVAREHYVGCEGGRRHGFTTQSDGARTSDEPV
ncbi:unnamed protein product [Phytophthora fragariaefolia]|uniref:Unnamed protein product n=1 Tax=Phytophthora fragariaefolia TaxID=1490495 RepID=A0A9W6TJ88_9STRA|nr:unnamed protein product [Phytophthora fragariaefolia]